MLIVNGYDCPRVLAELEEADITQIESFARDVLPGIIRKDQYKEYYGIFSGNVQSFTIVAGYRKILGILSKYCHDKTKNKIDDITKDKRHKLANFGRNLKGNYKRTKSPMPKSSIRSKRSCLSPVATTSAVNLVPDATSNLVSTSTSSLIPVAISNPTSTPLTATTTLPSEIGQIARALLNWIREKCGLDKWKSYEKLCEQITVTVDQDKSGTLKGTITCYCKESIKVYKLSRNLNCQKRWVLSNFHRHFKVHLLGNSGEMAKENTSHSAPHIRTIDCFFKPLVEKTNNLDIEESCSNPDQYKNSNLCKTVDSKIQIISNVCVKSPTKNNQECANVLGYSADNFQEENNEAFPKYDSGIADELAPGGNETSLTMNISNQRSKWLDPKYSRHDRSIRSRTKAVNSNQSLISDFYPHLEAIQSYLKSNPGLESKLNHSFKNNLEIRTHLNNLENNSTNKFLKLLFHVSIQNSKRSNNRNQYDDVLKGVALYLYYVGGRLLYEVLHANLKSIIPSISCLNRFARASTTPAEEGVFDFAGLRNFLESRGLPKFVWVSEDGTRISSKIEYDPKSNKIIGFTLPLKKGIPDVNAYPATCVKTIQNYFCQRPRSNYAYVIMVQPLCNAPAFCLAVFGTDNRFTHEDVISRWKYMQKTAQEFGITILGYSSDGDTRLLKAMRVNRCLPVPEEFEKSRNDPTFEWNWYQMKYKTATYTSEPKTQAEADPVSFVQDTVHIATKLRTRLIKPNIILPMGNFVASSDHLHTLIKSRSKDQHSLTLSDVKPIDKMNFSAAQKMCSPKICQLLTDCVTGSEGTVAYLEVMYYATSAFLETELTIEHRIYRLWYAVFFLRHWRAWILEQKNFTVKDNFLSNNSYLCVEINAHAIIEIVQIFRENDKLKNAMFLPWLFSSQTCEKIFRSSRSLTSTFSTVINFSMKDILHRLDRIQTINNIQNDLNGEFVFPREEKKKPVDIKGSDYDCKQFANDKIRKCVEQALTDCLSKVEKLGMSVKDPDNTCNRISIPLHTTEIENTDSDDEAEIDEMISFSNADGSETLESRFIEEGIKESNEHDVDNFETDLVLDISSISCTGSFGEKLQLKDYSKALISKTKDNHVNLSERSSYIQISVNNKTSIIRKSSLCWLLDQNCEKISTDRLRRFVQHKQDTNHANTVISNEENGNSKKVVLRKRKIIKSGHWCLFKHSNDIAGLIKTSSKQMIIGRVMYFVLASDTTNSNEVNEEQVSTANQSAKCFGNWYAMENDGRLSKINLDENFYCLVSLYQCTVPKPELQLVEDEIITRFASAAADAVKLKMGTTTRKKRVRKNDAKQNCSRKLRKRNTWDSLDDTESRTDTSDESLVELDDSTNTETFTTDSECEESEESLEFRCQKSDLQSNGEPKEKNQINETAKETVNTLMSEVSSPSDIQEGNFVIVEFTYNANTKRQCTKYFVSKIVCVDDEKITVNCMRSHKGKKDTFVFPDVEDKAVVNLSKIKWKLCNPHENRGIYTFPENVF